MCFVWIWEQTAIISLYSINWLVCITETKCVYCAVRTGSLYIIQVMCFVWIWEQTAIISLYSINYLLFLMATDCGLCLVWTESLYLQPILSRYPNSTLCLMHPTILYQNFTIKLPSKHKIQLQNPTHFLHRTIQTVDFPSLYLLQIRKLNNIPSNLLTPEGRAGYARKT